VRRTTAVATTTAIRIILVTRLTILTDIAGSMQAITHIVGTTIVIGMVATIPTAVATTIANAAK